MRVKGKVRRRVREVRRRVRLERRKMILTVIMTP